MIPSFEPSQCISWGHVVNHLPIPRRQANSPVKDIAQHHGATGSPFLKLLPVGLDVSQPSPDLVEGSAHICAEARGVCPGENAILVTMTQEFNSGFTKICPNLKNGGYFAEYQADL